MYGIDRIIQLKYGFGQIHTRLASPPTCGIFLSVSAHFGARPPTAVALAGSAPLYTSPGEMIQSWEQGRERVFVWVWVCAPFCVLVCVCVCVCVHACVCVYVWVCRGF